MGRPPRSRPDHLRGVPRHLGRGGRQPCPGYGDELDPRSRGRGDAAGRAGRCGASSATPSSSASPSTCWPLLAALEHRAAVDGRLSVLDFGGSLGSTYRQHRRLPRRPSPTSRGEWWSSRASWPPGRAEFSTDRLSLPRVDRGVQRMRSVPTRPAGQRAAVPAGAAGTRSASSSPPGASDVGPGPHSHERLRRRRAHIQHVPPTIYQAEYPMWVLSRTALLSPWAAHGTSLPSTTRVTAQRPRRAAARSAGAD